MAVVTISRQYGSGGVEIAARTCELLECRYLDKTLMAEIASEIGISEDQIFDFSEDAYQARSLFQRLLGRDAQVPAEAEGSMAVDTQYAEGEEVDVESAIQVLTAIIKAAYEQGDVVILGRGGQAILQGMPGVLHVRIEAPLERRIELVRYREMEGLTPDFQLKSAQEMIEQRDRATEEYLERFFDVDWADPGLYHLVIDTTKWGTETAPCLIASAVDCLPAVP